MALNKQKKKSYLNGYMKNALEKKNMNFSSGRVTS